MTTNTTASFTLDTLTVKGQTFPAQYSITPSGTVYAFVTIAEDGQPVNLRVKIEPTDPAYTAALAAARRETDQPQPAPVQDATKAKTGPAKKAPRPAQAKKACKKKTAPVAQAAPIAAAQALDTPAPVAQPAPVAPVQPAAPAPDKSFIGTTIQGPGWRIVFDGDAARTRVILQDGAPDAMREAVQAAGFYWSSVQESYNKKLTFKAYRAAQALAQQLHAIPA